MARDAFHTDRVDDSNACVVSTPPVDAPYDFGHVTVRVIGAALPMLMLGLSLFFILK